MDFLKVEVVQAASQTLTERVDWKGGEFSNTEADTKAGDIKLLPSGTWAPRSFAYPALALSTATSVVSDGTYIYLLIGNNNIFQKYIPEQNEWVDLQDAPLTALAGSDMTYSNGYIYAIFGGYTKKMYRYSIGSNTWDEMADLPDLVQVGASLATDGTKIYALRGTATTDFWIYTIATNRWDLNTGPAATIYQGSDLVYYNNNLYTPRGYNTTTMYRYDILAGTWSTKTSFDPLQNLAAVPGLMYDETELAVKDGLIYVPRGYGTNEFYRYNIATNVWETSGGATPTLPTTPQVTRYVGVVYNAGDDQVYQFRGNGSYDMWKYDETHNVFMGPADPPLAPGSGADLAYYNGEVYYPRGGGGSYRQYYKYTVATNAWTTLTDSPNGFTDDCSSTVANGKIYYLRCGGTLSFYGYDPVANNWSPNWATPLADTLAAMYYGASIVYPGSGDYMYATRGAYTRTFYRYSIPGNSWDDVSVADLPDNAEASYGARLIAYNADTLYYFSGAQTSQVLTYTISTNTWTSVNSLPYAPFWGVDAELYNGKVYILAGYQKTDFWEYDIAGNSWRRLLPTQNNYNYDLGFYNGASLTSDGTGGFYVIYGQSVPNMTYFTVSSNNYQASGTWLSSIMDLTYVSSWTSLSSTTTTPGDSSITFQTRTSADRRIWSSWEDVSGTTISSPAARYIQLKASLVATTDLTQSPSLHALSVNYTGDENDPSNPSSVTAKSREIGGVTLTSGETYNHTYPYFYWTASADGETTVTGYYVYFGTNSSADPETEGNFQTLTDYTVTTPLQDGTYYLRLSTKDAAGNVSSGVTRFTYVYNGVDVTSLTYNTTAVFSQGTADDIDTSNDKIKLESKDGFWLQERLTMAPVSIAYGSAMAYRASTNKLYVMRGYNSNVFYEYDIATDVWTPLSITPSNVIQGGELVEGPDGFLYATPGGNTNKFWVYNIDTNSWSDEDAADGLQPFYYGSSMIFDGDQTIYALKGNGDDIFLSYNVIADEWAQLSNLDFGAPINHVTNNATTGADIAYDSEDNVLYIIQGGYPGFTKFDPSTSTYTPLEPVPYIPSYGSQLQYDSETDALYYRPGNNTPYQYKYDLGSQTWTKLADGPTAFYQDSQSRIVDGNIYIIRSNYSQNFYKYSIEDNSWLIPTRGIFGNYYLYSAYMSSNYGSDVVRGDGNNIYILQGNYNNRFVRYNTVTGTATILADTPNGAYNGGTLGYDDDRGKIYFIPSIYSRRLFTYDISLDEWSEVTTDPPPIDASTGTSLVYDGAQYMYWIPGGGSAALYRYDITGSPGTRWLGRQNAPAGLNYGSQLVYKGGYIYVMRGGNALPNAIYRYDPSPTGNTWTSSLATLNARVYNDGFMVDGGGDYLYVCLGGNSRSCYKYSIGGNAWTALANAPAQIYTGGGGALANDGRMYVIAGAGTDTYADGLYTYVPQTSTTSFEETGTYTSMYHDLTDVYKFSNLSVNYTNATNASISVYTCTSSTNSGSCDTWNQATEEKLVGSNYSYKINSDAARYIQVKIELTSGDGVYSPEVNSYSVNYYRDTTDPTNPTAVNSYVDDTKAQSIITNTWYSHSGPHFDWPDAEEVGGASDGSGGSGIVGYYVYFGVSPTGDPSGPSGELVIDSEYTAAGLTSGETYYFRIEAVDDAGNAGDVIDDLGEVVPGSADPFIYKFDNVAPSVPTDVQADPSGYSATDAFDFTWDASTDTASGIAEYCYKTGASSGDYSVDQCTTQLTVLDIPSYKSANNTFYVRAKDNAGNYSAYVPGTYYYSSSAPGGPQNLTVTATYPLNGDPTSSTTNSFAFSWDVPSSYFGNSANLVYYYSINALPTANSTSSTSLKSLMAGPYATLPGENVFYVVAKDESGRIDYATYSSVTFTANTAAPGIPNNIDIADVSVKTTSSWKLATSWEEPTDVGSGVATYDIFRSADGTSYSKVANTAGISFVDTRLLQQVYYYKVRACDNTNNCGAFSTVVSLYPDGKFTEPAALVGDPLITNITTRQATISWSTARTSDSKIAFGTSSGDYNDEEVASSEQVTDHSLSLLNLQPGTTYYFEAKWTDEDGNTGVADEFTFQTLPAPSAKEVGAVNIGLTTADIQFTSKDGAKARVYFGETSAFGGLKEIGIGTTESTYLVRLEELKDGTKYYYKLNLLDADGAEYEGDIYSFETLPRPKIDGVKIIQVKGTAVPTVYVTWSTNTEISSIVTYYPTGNAGAAQDAVNIALEAGKHRMLIEGLLPNTPYSIIVSGRDKAGNEARSEELAITTSSDTRPPLVANLKVEGSVLATSGGPQQAQLVVSWNTDEQASSQVEFGEGSGTTYSNKSQEDTSLRFNHLVVVSGLSPSKVYHLRVISKDSAGNETKSIDTVTITPKATDNALDLVVTNLSEAFGFLGNIER